MNECILVVDDEEAILKGINLNLGRKFDITLAHGSEEALKQLEKPVQRTTTQKIKNNIQKKCAVLDRQWPIQNQKPDKRFAT